MATALRLQLGPGWVCHLWERELSDTGAFCLKIANNKKWKLEMDHSLKISEKFKHQRLMKKYSSSSQATQDSA